MFKDYNKVLERVKLGNTVIEVVENGVVIDDPESLVAPGMEYYYSFKITCFRTHKVVEVEFDDCEIKEVEILLTTIALKYLCNKIELKTLETKKDFVNNPSKYKFKSPF